MEDINADPDVVEVNLVAAELKDFELYEGFKLDMYAYNGQIPGPRIQAKLGDEVIVHFRNDLPEPTTIHWHGLRIPSEMDGTPRVQDPVQPGATFTYRFTVKDAASYWYHPHVRSNEQVEKGLYGTLVVHDPETPKVDLERYVVLDDILLTQTGHAPFLTSRHTMVHGRGGNVLLTNGSGEKVTHSAIKGQTERWRVLNSANASTFEISLEGADWTIIGTDGGLISAPYKKERVLLPVGQRYELLVKYTQAGKVALNRHVLVRDNNGDIVKEPISTFEVEVADSEAEPVELGWPTVSPMPFRETTREVTMEFDAVNNPDGSVKWLINGVAHREEPLYTFMEGETVLVHLVNKLGPEHPFHLHGQFFEVLNIFGERGMFSDYPGLKDTVLLPGFKSVDILAYMDNPGRWMVHCHILEHSKLGMMAEVIVTPKE